MKPWDLNLLESEALEDEPQASFIVLLGSTTSTAHIDTIPPRLGCLYPSAQRVRVHPTTERKRPVGATSLEYEKALKDAFIRELNDTIVTCVQQPFDNPTSDFSSQIIPDLPQKVRAQLLELQHASENGNDLYETADVVAEWVVGSSELEQTGLATYLSDLSPKAACTLLSAFADAEALLKSETLLRTVANFVFSDDKRLAQAAAACLLACGESFGKTLLEERMQAPEDIPHVRLVQGIVDLLDQ